MSHSGKTLLQLTITSLLVGVAQLVEPRIVIPVVAGSIPVVHPSINRPAISKGIVGFYVKEPLFLAATILKIARPLCKFP